MKKRNTIAAMLLVTGVMALAGCSSYKKEQEAIRMEGIAAMKEGKYREAVDLFNRSLQLGKGEVTDFQFDLLKYRAQAEMELGAYPEAAKTYEILIEAEKADPEYISRAAISYARGGELDEAKKLYDRLMTLFTDKKESVTADQLAESLKAICRAFREAGDTDTVLAMVNQAAESGIESADICNSLAVVALENDNADQALNLIRKGLSLKDESVERELLINEAAAYEKKQDFKEALKILEECVNRFGATEELTREIAFLKTR